MRGLAVSRFCRGSFTLSLALVPLACSSSSPPSSSPPPAEGKSGPPSPYTAERAVASWSAPPCGSVLGSWDGTSAYSNGSDTGSGDSCAGRGAYGDQYQCVELVMRHFKTHWGLSWWGNAAQLLQNAPAGEVDVYANGQAASHPPAPGDLIVWNDTPWGHTALVTAASATSIAILEQNVWGAGGWATLPVVGGTVHGPSGWGWADPAGWAHAKANGGGSGGGGPSCVNDPGVGDDCGNESVISGGSATTLYHCNGPGAATVVASCTQGCVHEPPGTDDACNTATCVNDPGVGDNCGDEHVVAGGAAGLLYACNGAGPAKLLAQCANGCKHNPPGVNDACR